MNASQRRIIRRAIVRNLTLSGIVPGASVARKAPGKSVATLATVELVTFDWGNPRRPLVQVKRRDRQSAIWPVSELCHPA